MTRKEGKNIKKILVGSLIAVFVMSLIAGLILGVQPVSAASSKKAPIHINNTGGGALSYYQVNLNITYDSDMNNSFSDLRVKNETAGTFIPYWIEDKVDGAWCNLWFNATSIPASSWCNDTYYLYYGDAGASSDSNITTTFLFGDDFDDDDDITTVPFTIESTKAIGNYSCHGCSTITNHSTDEYWVSWHYNPDDVSGDTLPENITKMVLYTNNNTNSSLSWITQESHDQEMPSQIEKIGNTYYSFFSNATGGLNTGPFVLEYKNSSDGVTWNGPYSLGTSSTKRPSSKLMKINDTIWWIVHANLNATASSVRYIQFNATSGVFGSETDIVASSTTNWLYQTFGLYNSSTDKYFIYYFRAGSPHELRVVNRTGGGSWSSPTTITTETVGYIAPWVIDWNSQFFLFYYDTNYDIKVMSGTDGVSFSALQTLHSDASDWYWYPAVAPINSTHLVMVYSWSRVSPDTRIIYWDILKYNPEVDTNKWDETGSPDSVTVANSIVDIYKSADTWGGISSKTSYGVYNIAYRARVKYAGAKSTTGMSNVFPDMYTAADTINFLEYPGDPIRYCTINDGIRTYTEGVSEHSNYHVDEAKWKSGEVKLYRDGVLKATHTTDIPDEAMKVGLIARANHTYADWILVRKYASPEPNALLGSEQTAGEGDCTTPTITDLTNSTPGTTNVTITWSTNQSTDNRVKYSKNSDLSNEEWSSWNNDTYSISIELSSLDSGTPYYYQAWSYNGTNSSCSITEPVSSPYKTFTTQSTGGGAYNITLLSGWNIIGWTDTTTRTASYVANDIGSNCTYVTERNKTSGNYETFDPNFPDYYNFDVERGWGYFTMISGETLWGRDA